MSLTVACLWVKGEYPYSLDYVTRLEMGVTKYLRRPFRFVCLTDRPDAVSAAGIEAIRVERIPECWALWTKLRVFDPALGLTGRVLYLDLDTLIVGALDPIVDYPAACALTADAFIEERAHLTTDRYGRALKRRFNSSVMVWDAGTQDRLWTDWSPAEATRLSTDQDWIGEQAPDAQEMPLAWFPRISRVQPPWPDDAKVVLVKKPKNHIAAKQWPWFADAWGAA